MTETIQHFIDSGDRCEVHCNRCGHHAPLDHVKLRDRLGPDHGALHNDLVPLLRCSRCGSKDLGMIRSPRSTKDIGWANSRGNAYAKAKGG